MASQMGVNHFKIWSIALSSTRMRFHREDCTLLKIKAICKNAAKKSKST